MGEIMRVHPVVTDEVTHIMAMRRTQPGSALKNMGKAGLHNNIRNRHSEVLAIIKRFFGL
ncbi:MAG TPA: hypothetical protein VMV88_08545 [Gallionella sp.]|nr:hypothetical protein [Gallionella sp.]